MTDPWPFVTSPMTPSTSGQPSLSCSALFCSICRTHSSWRWRTSTWLTAHSCCSGNSSWICNIFDNRQQRKIYHQQKLYSYYYFVVILKPTLPLHNCNQCQIPAIHRQVLTYCRLCVGHIGKLCKKQLNWWKCHSEATFMWAQATMHYTVVHIGTTRWKHSNDLCSLATWTVTIITGATGLMDICTDAWLRHPTLLQKLISIKSLIFTI